MLYVFVLVINKAEILSTWRKTIFHQPKFSYILVLLSSLGRYFCCWWTISPRWYHPPSCFYTDMVY